MGKARYEAWRHVPLKNGGTLHCGMCWHERVLGFCKEMERINLFYLDWEKLRYTIVTGDVYSNLQARKRMHNKRARERSEPEINIVAFPENTGRIIVLHDAPAD